MPNCKTLVPFNGTKEQKERLKEVIRTHKGEKGATMPVMQEAQKIYGYLPEEVQVMIAEGLEIPLTEVYGISSFYAQFTHNPKGEVQISVCLGTACYVKGAAEILDRVCKKVGCLPDGISTDGKFSIDSTRCIGACGLAPVMIINNDVYGRLKPEDVDAIIEKYM
ncbi:MAG: NAD(P)H-dependent oxidoreductase subunit E [Peptococcaceae bacterium]|jgi:NADH-quinone oxidoreductase subunit E/NADP-reducing hydrogenase subunit HndA|nr:NAD(P)H-dependent oxidoreductase subunit E [Peptococcaceae bacterium]